MDHPCALGAAVRHHVQPVHILLNPGHVEDELGVLMVWKLSRPERDSNPRYSAWIKYANHQATQSTLWFKVVVVRILSLPGTRGT